MLHALLTGFMVQLSIIVAIGAQNAYLLKQGITRNHVTIAISVCVVGDLVLIAAGVAGLGALLTHAKTLLSVLRYGGVVYLGGFAVRSLWRSWKGHGGLVAAGDPSTRRTVLLTTMGFTFLNPHVYIDALIVVGTLSAQFGPNRWFFGFGSGLVSVLWFALVGYGARRLAPWFSQGRSWRWLDGGIGVIMLFATANLLWT